MIAGEKKTAGPEMKFLDEALLMAREVVVLRGRLVAAQQEHGELLEQREEALREGRGILPQVRELFLEIESLPAKTAQSQERMNWLIEQGVAKLNAENSQIAARQYMKSRDSLRQVLERFREGLVSVLVNIKAGEDLGPSLTEAHNSKLGEIERTLGGVHFSRVTYRVPPLPTLDGEIVRRGRILDAIDQWIAGVR